LLQNAPTSQDSQDLKKAVTQGLSDAQFVQNFTDIAGHPMATPRQTKLVKEAANAVACEPFIGEVLDRVLADLIMTRVAASADTAPTTLTHREERLGLLAEARAQQKIRVANAAARQKAIENNPFQRILNVRELVAPDVLAQPLETPHTRPCPQAVAELLNELWQSIDTDEDRHAFQTVMVAGLGEEKILQAFINLAGHPMDTVLIKKSARIVALHASMEPVLARIFSTPVLEARFAALVHGSTALSPFAVVEGRVGLLVRTLAQQQTHAAQKAAEALMTPSACASNVYRVVDARESLSAQLRSVGTHPEEREQLTEKLGRHLMFDHEGESDFIKKELKLEIDGRRNPDFYPEVHFLYGERLSANAEQGLDEAIKFYRDRTHRQAVAAIEVNAHPIASPSTQAPSQSRQRRAKRRAAVPN
jgi:hypothetical protein